MSEAGGGWRTAEQVRRCKMAEMVNREERIDQVLAVVRPLLLERWGGNKFKLYPELKDLAREVVVVFGAPYLRLAWQGVSERQACWWLNVPHFWSETVLAWELAVVEGLLCLSAERVEGWKRLQGRVPAEVELYDCCFAFPASKYGRHAEDRPGILQQYVARLGPFVARNLSLPLTVHHVQDLAHQSLTGQHLPYDRL